jgi:hypothetical protein
LADLLKLLASELRYFGVDELVQVFGVADPISGCHVGGVAVSDAQVPKVGLSANLDMHGFIITDTN